MLKIIYTLDPIPTNSTVPSVFLAGPTYRVTKNGQYTPPSWREDAVTELKKAGFEGFVYLPEWESNIKPANWTYSRQVDWEMAGLEKATVIIFWIPRDMKTLPALTTNIEFGEWMHSNKIVAGAPDNAEKNDYIKEKCSRYNIPWTNNMKTCVANAINKINNLNNNAQNIWFISDTHFGQARTLELSKRPYTSVDEMDWDMIKNWNTKITNEDTVYHLGDFGNPEVIKYLKGKQINLLPGNYDTPEILEALSQDPRVKIIPSGTVIQVGNKATKLIHEPENGDGDGQHFYLYGHIHQLQMVKKNGLNVGVDCHNYTPINPDTIEFYRNAILKHYDHNVFIEDL